MRHPNAEERLIRQRYPSTIRVGPTPRGVSRRAFAAWIVLVALGSGVGAFAAPSSPRAGARVVAQDLRGVSLEYRPARAVWDTTGVGEARYERVRLPGASVIDPPGRPALPIEIVQIAVPDGMSARLRVDDEASYDRPGLPPVPVASERFVADDPRTGPVSDFRFDPESAIYAGVHPYPDQVAVVGGGHRLGERWVVPIRIAPIRWNPSSGAYRVLERIALRVEFVPATDQERKLRSTARPGSDSRSWRRIQDRAILNAATAKTFPQRPRGIPLAPAAPRLLDGNPEFKIAVTQTGWASVSYATLAASGFPAGISLAKIGVWERGYSDAGDSATAAPIPVVTRETTPNGIFDAGDAITFYARSLRDRVGPTSIENRYADANVYWLTWTAADAAVPDTIDGVIPTPAPTAPTSFPHQLHLEQENYVLTFPSPTAGAPKENVSHFFWTNGGSPDFPESFQTPIPFVDADPTQPFRIRARYQGVVGSFHRVNAFFQSSTGQRDTLALGAVSFNQEVYVLDTGFTIPGSHIGAGATNEYQFTGDHQAPSGGIALNGSFTLLDWIDVDYARQFVARNDRLEFSSGGAGSVEEITVTGFTTSTIDVFDVTNPTAAERVVGAQVTGAPGAYQVVFRTNAIAGPRRFVALTPGSARAVAAGEVTADTPSTLRVPTPAGPSPESRAVIIAPAAFFPAATKLADYRRTQGHLVELADVQDIYDEFNGGVKSARAIRRYLRHGYRAWTPRLTFVVLAGDASLDYKKRLATSSVDRVPTYLKFESIAGPQGSELVAEDSYYSIDLDLPEPTETEILPDLMLGRIPAGSNAELDAYVTKVMAYENFQPTDTWRGRQLLVSDDEFSTTIFFAGSYCKQPSEVLFRAANQAMADVTAQSASGQDIQSVFYDIKTYTDAVPTFIDGFGNTCKNATEAVSVMAQTGGGQEQFAQRLSQGALLVNVQAHANRYFVAHENLYCTSPSFCNSLANPGTVQNIGRPFVWMVWGCHANQFPDGPLGRTGFSDSTDSQGETLLMLPNRGSVISFGSSGYEFLQTNATFNGFVAEGFYTAPPVVGPDGQARWIAGEIFQHAYTRNAGTNFFTQQVMNLTLQILGDPMTRIDALAPRIFEVTLDGAAVASGAPLTTDSPTDSVAVVAKVRDEVAVTRVAFFERAVGAATATPLDSTRFTVVFSDSARQATISGNVRPRVGNYDIEIEATDYNGRVQTFPLAVRTPIRYVADDIEIIDGVFIAGGSLLRAEITAPIPLTADSLSLRYDGVPITAAATALDGTGRRWALESLAGDRGPGQHTIQVAVGGRTDGLDAATFQISAQFTLRGVAVVDPRRQGAGCGGSIFQYELSAPASKVELFLYTVAGRRVASFPLPGAAGYNVFCWDGRDSQGHIAATGVYLYRVRARDDGGRVVSYDGRMIRSR